MGSADVSEALEIKLNATFAPSHLEVINESAHHSRGAETHFKVIIASKAFGGLSRVKRQQAVYAACEELLEANGGPVHALTMTAMTEDEWVSGRVLLNVSPSCSAQRPTR